MPAKTRTTQRVRRQAPSRPRWPLFAGIAGAVVVVAIVAVALLGGRGATQISSAQLQQELAHKDFVLLNVKTPYVGEIQGTDLWIPYDQLAGRASELPADKSAKIVVYCRTGHESAMAVQTLEGMGYTNLEELAGGMTAWTAGGGSLVSVSH